MTITNSFNLLILTILLVRNLYGLTLNTTTIEFWEIERHEAVLRRQRARSRNFEGRGEDVGRTIVVKQEFPYDIGIWQNLKAGMGGSSNVSLYLVSAGDCVYDHADPLFCTILGFAMVLAVCSYAINCVWIGV